jgi:hypothetical protein
MSVGGMPSESSSGSSRIAISDITYSLLCKDIALPLLTSAALHWRSQKAIPRTQLLSASGPAGPCGWHKHFRFCVSSRRSVEADPPVTTNFPPIAAKLKYVRWLRLHGQWDPPDRSSETGPTVNHRENVICLTFSRMN